MADHDVFFTVPEQKLGRTDIEVRVKRNGGAFGRLLISEGALEWLPAKKWGKSGIRIGWVQFDDFARSKRK
jgi:hypothetical protein